MLDDIAPDWLALVRASVEIANRRRQREDLPSSTVTAIDAQLQELAARPGFWSAFGLTPAEVLAAWTAICAQLDPELEAHLERLGGSVDVTLGALAAIAFRTDLAAAMRALSDAAPLFRLRLLEPVVETHQSAAPWIRQRVRASRFLLGAALGVGSEDLRALEPDRHDIPAAVITTGHVSEEIAAALGQPCLLLVTGGIGTGRRTVIEHAARAAGRGLIAIDCRKLAREPAAFREQLVGVARAARLHRALPIFANLDALVGDPQDDRLRVLTSEVARWFPDGASATAIRRIALRCEHPVVVTELRPLSYADRVGLWQRSLAQGTVEDAELLAAAYPLAPATIVKAGAAARARSAGKPLQPDDVFAGIRVVLDDALGAFASRVEVTQTWNDLVLAHEHRAQVLELVSRVRERHKVYEAWGFQSKLAKGLGVSALFSGPPGTGKTMVASLIARELGLELYQVDLSKVVSKWIGETEKNLAALFDAAEACQAVLLFDEADALFGKRTDVKSSNDRYANFETNFLLQRLESFTGICLLTTNHESSMDAAFQRRLSFHLRFALPEADERARLWHAMLPEAAPVAGDLDFASLAARYIMSGGYIRNAVVRAAFVAAGEGTAIAAAHLEQAARQEYEAMGKIV